MGKDSKIAWTKHTFNGWIGCEHASEGCDFCYAETMVKRAPQLVHGQPGLHLPTWGADAPRRMTSPDYWKNLGRWNAAAQKAGVRERVFINSMSDIFEDWQGQVLNADGFETLNGVRSHLWMMVDLCPALDFLLLTKRPQNIMDMVPLAWHTRWPRNVWVGCTAENQTRLEERIEHLKAVPAYIKYISYEPALGPLDFKIDPDATMNRFGLLSCARCRGWGESCKVCDGTGTAISWVIIGGESGHKARPFDLMWARSVIEQCKTAAVDVFMKQIGHHCVNSANGQKPTRNTFPGSSAHDDMMQWPADLRVRQVPIGIDSGTLNSTSQGQLSL